MTTRKSSPITPADELLAQCETTLAENEALAEALQGAQQALQRRVNIEAAIMRTREQAAAAKRRIEQIDAALPDLDAQLALAGGDAAIDPALGDEVARLQAKVDDATRERADKKAEIERGERTVNVLENEVVAVDAEITAARLAADSARAAVRVALMPHIDQAVERACAELARVKAIMRALALVGVPLEDDAAALRVVAPGAAYLDLSSPNEVIARGTDLLAQVELATVRARDGMSETVRRMRAHRPYAVTRASVFEKALAEPCVPRSASPERIAEIERREHSTQATSRRASMPTSWSGLPR